MAKTVLIDSGPIVAVLRRRDQHHGWARAHFETSNESFATCEAVISESHFLLEGTPGGVEALYALLERSVIKVPFSLTNQLDETVRLIRRYHDIPMSLADACLVRMAELEEDIAVFTTDTDFRLYRRNGRQVIPVIMPT
ncbi:MAG: PIN domain-containing protein [Chthoniobacterales bacterium]